MQIQTLVSNVFNIAGIDLIIMPAHMMSIPVQWNHLSFCFRIGIERRAQKTIDAILSMAKNPAFFMNTRPIRPVTVEIMSMRVTCKKKLLEDDIFYLPTPTVR